MSSSDRHIKAEIRNLSFFYGTYQALKSISLPLHRNRVTAFIGPSGCGKSTLLRVLNRIYEIYPNQRAEGEVLLDGENISRARRGCHAIAQPGRNGFPEAYTISNEHLR